MPATWLVPPSCFTAAIRAANCAFRSAIGRGPREPVRARPVAGGRLPLGLGKGLGWLGWMDWMLLKYKLNKVKLLNARKKPERFGVNLECNSKKRRSMFRRFHGARCSWVMNCKKKESAGRGSFIRHLCAVWNCHLRGVFLKSHLSAWDAAISITFS